jgi:hypothetical protein
MPERKPYNKNQPARQFRHRQLVDRVRNLEDQIEHLLVRIERLELQLRVQKTRDLLTAAA